MADHDPMCPNLRPIGDPEWDICDCSLIARVRADEREQPAPAGWGIPVYEHERVRDERDRAREGERILSGLLAHAEAVAMRMVEVICEDGHWRELLEAKLDRISLMWQAACNERDAARAEVEKWKINASMAQHERDAARAEVGALREQMSHMYQAETFTDTDGYPSTRVFRAEVVGENEWAAHIRREVLDDLRAKLETLPLVGEEQTPMWAKVYRQSVLDMIDEARP